MKAAVTNYVLFGLLCVTVLFVSMAVAAEVAQAKPVDGNFEAELASGRCIHGCCNRNFIGKCKVCCASAEEAKAAMVELSHGLGARRGGYGAAEEAKEKEAKP